MAWFAHASNAVNVGKAVGEASGRSCTINITNGSRVYSLVNPKVWMISGYNTHPPPPTVGSKQKGVCAFSKTTGTATGAVGVLTYDLFIREKCRAEKMMAIMFSVPFDYTYYENWLAVGIFDLGQPCDHALYNLMYYKHDPRFVRARATDPSMLFTWGSVEIRASMSNACSAIAQVEIHDKCNSKMCY